MPPSWTHTSLAQQVVFGPGALRELPAIVRNIGARRALLVTTTGRAASSAGEQVVALLGRSLESTFDEVTSHVPVPLVQQAVLQARRDAVDLVVSLGGGSCADLGKAVCFFLEQEAGMPGASHLDRPVVPHVSIPTTYSGAELTPFFGMTDPATRQKQGAGGPTSAPVVAVYDPELTLSTPPHVSAETGMNALAHCVEALYGPDANPVASAMAEGGIRALADGLPVAVARPDDLDGRAESLRGAWLAGAALGSAGTGFHHQICHVLGGAFGLDHGGMNAVVLPHAVAYVTPAVPGLMRRVADGLGADNAATGCWELARRVRAPASLAELGLAEADPDRAAELCANHVSQTPRPSGAGELRALLGAAHAGAPPR
jgi:maleylacetate reductase